MNTLYLEPTDVLFFRDGRPMSGSLSGHGAAWPLPTVTNAALHAALHRAEIDGGIKNDKGVLVKVHGHDHRRDKQNITDARKFGSLLTAGPFPTDKHGNWYFPRPLDANCKGSAEVSFLPLTEGFDRKLSSLPEPLKFPVANEKSATKDKPANWWGRRAWDAYLSGRGESTPDDFKTDGNFSDTESTFGIGIDPDTGTQNGEQFYSASYLRLQPGWRLGLLAEAWDKIDNNCSNKRDLIKGIFPNSGARTGIIAGGQQRVCTVERRCGEEIKLPIGKNGGFTVRDGKHLVKWILLTPAIFPEIPDKNKHGNPMIPHRGGWLPNWIAEKEQPFEGETVGAGSVLLLDGPGKKKALRRKTDPGKRIQATLVAAMIAKPLPVTGYALSNDADPERKAGAKSTHLAVPAGSVYYFECDSPKDARALAAALNWHGEVAASFPLADDQAGGSAHSPQAGGLWPQSIRNRRSTLMGEKGFGLGVCGTWDFHCGKSPH